LALTHQQKEQMLQEYAGKVERSPVMIWANYRGLTVPQIQEYRRQMRAVGAEAVVVKNTLMRLALEQAKRPTNAEIMDGPCVVTFAYGDVAVTTKAGLDYARLHDNVFQVAGGVVGNGLATVDQLRTLTTLPSREVLLARAIGGIQSPISGFVGTLAAVIRGLVNVLNAHQEQLEGAPS
jgi:large subunit ribosomal protein L10